MTLDPSGDPPAATMRRDLISAYLASATRFGSSVIVSALVFRFVGAAEFAMLALVRGTIGLLNYTSLGLAPALIHRAADAAQAPHPARIADSRHRLDNRILSYSGPPPTLTSPLAELHSTALVIAYATALIAGVATLLYAMWFNKLYRVPAGLERVMPMVVIWIGGGVLMRLASDAAGAVLQVRGRIALDNKLLATADALWVAIAGVFILLGSSAAEKLNTVASAFMISSVFVLLVRSQYAAAETGVHYPLWRRIDIGIAKALLGYGLLVVAAQLADYLYAPTDYILIDRLLSPTDVAFYAPAVQIDSGLLLLVTGLSAVMLPKAALAHAGGSTRTVRAYYVRGTLASLLLLVLASACVWAAGPWIFRLWLGNPMPQTQAILPLVLIGTTLGGASAVGRSILFAVGKAKPFAISVLIAGVVNVGCSYVFVRYFHRGLQGILLGTVVAVVLRCVVWMPWYVLRVLRYGSAEEMQNAKQAMQNAK
jgi:O-antigen/teichoic acid export membrane protein